MALKKNCLYANTFLHPSISCDYFIVPAGSSNPNEELFVIISNYNINFHHIYNQNNDLFRVLDSEN